MWWFAWRGARAKRAPFCPVWQGGMVRSRLTPVLVAGAFAVIGPRGGLLPSGGSPAQAWSTTTASAGQSTTTPQGNTTTSAAGNTTTTAAGNTTTTAAGNTTTTAAGNT